jgi:hypothetical protein
LWRVAAAARAAFPGPTAPFVTRVAAAAFLAVAFGPEE